MVRRIFFGGDSIPTAERKRVEAVELGYVAVRGGYRRRDRFWVG
jgi:hypothetical protein